MKCETLGPLAKRNPARGIGRWRQTFDSARVNLHACQNTRCPQKLVDRANSHECIPAFSQLRKLDHSSDELADPKVYHDVEKAPVSPRLGVDFNPLNTGSRNDTLGTTLFAVKASAKAATLSSLFHVFHLPPRNQPRVALTSRHVVFILPSISRRPSPPSKTKSLHRHTADVARSQQITPSPPST